MIGIQFKIDFMKKLLESGFSEDALKNKVSYFIFSNDKELVFQNDDSSNP